MQSCNQSPLKRDVKIDATLFYSRFRCFLHHLLHHRRWTSAERRERVVLSLRGRTRGRTTATSHLFLRSPRRGRQSRLPALFLRGDDDRRGWWSWRMHVCVRAWGECGASCMNESRYTRSRTHTRSVNETSNNATAVGRGIMGPRLTEIRCGYRSINSSRKQAAQKPLIFPTTMIICWSHNEKSFKNSFPL